MKEYSHGELLIEPYVAGLVAGGGCDVLSPQVHLSLPCERQSNFI